jgi:hypothetical protein
MKEFSEINKGVGTVMELMKTMKYTPDEKIAILRSAADLISNVMSMEVLVKSLALSFRDKER